MSSEEITEEALAKISQFSEPNRLSAQKMHAAISEAEPKLQPRLWYGMPGYALSKDGPVLCFFREDDEYMTFGYTEKVNVAPKPDATDKLMPCAWFFNELDDATVARVKEIVRDIVQA